ncbi:hypothetical protein B0A50_05931 [Salinomyces thailandicus]|uniref:Elongin-C n=1 Tax=Salinomyces thailandicus TaxID=706561 RepID=A0A4U0TSM5_9PEZI|nr:hypothetical protein B0A50_05931 [Salinomyces thailandica]
MASQTDYVTLISNDDFSFVVQRSAACISPAIRKMLDPQSMFMEAKTNTIRFDNFNALVLEKVCEYFYYNERNKDARDVPDPELPTELVLELLMAGDYLDC